MTIRDLIELLNGLDPDMPVLTPNYEIGYSDLRSHEVDEVVMNFHLPNGSSYGPHELAKNIGDTTIEDMMRCRALLLGAQNPSRYAPHARELPRASRSTNKETKRKGLKDADTLS